MSLRSSDRYRFTAILEGRAKKYPDNEIYSRTAPRISASYPSPVRSWP